MAKVLITGTSKEIGYHATLHLARAGHEIIATMRNPGACDLERVAKDAKLPVTESLAQEVKGFGIRVAMIEPGIIDTPMATSNLPQGKENTIYPHGGRMRAFFTSPGQPEAPANLVAETIRHVIESSDPRLRFPVGPDSLPFLEWRSSLSDEDWVGLGALKTDADYFNRVFMDTGVDLR